MQMMLNGGVYVSDAGERKKIFEKDTVELFTTKATDVPYNNSRALGWDTVPISDHKACGDCFSERSFGHTGYTGTRYVARPSQSSCPPLPRTQQHRSFQRRLGGGPLSTLFFGQASPHSGSLKPNSVSTDSRTDSSTRGTASGLTKKRT